MHPLHIKTPLIESLALGQHMAGSVWLKMEACQPTGSFKPRGIGHACQQQQINGARFLISSSGGNAGLAVAYSGRKLNMPTTVVVPKTTSKTAIELITLEKAKVIIEGETWFEAHQYAMTLAGNDGAYIHPFDDPLLWQGHASVIDEVAESGLIPDAVVLSVGGGGLLCGVLEGLHRNQMQDVPVIAVETLGADAFNQSLTEGRLVELDTISSIATSLGAKQVAKQAFEWRKRHKIISHTVSDLDAVNACLQFAKDHRVIVEPACGASLASIYQPITALKDKMTVLVIVCGGVATGFEQLQALKSQLEQ